MHCHTGKPCRRHRTWPPTPSQYTNTVLTCSCAFHWCGTSHWSTQLPNFNVFGKTRSGHPSSTFHTPANERYDDGMLVVSQKLGGKCIVPTGSWTRDMWCANQLRYPIAHSCFLHGLLHKYNPQNESYASKCIIHTLYVKAFMISYGQWPSIDSLWIMNDVYINGRRLYRSTL